LIVTLEDVDTPTPWIDFHVESSTDRDDQLRTVDSFAKALGVPVQDYGPQNTRFTAEFQGTKVEVRTSISREETWRPQTQLVYDASLHAEELLDLAGVLRALGPQQVHDLRVRHREPNFGSLFTLTVNVEGLEQLEKLNGSPVEPTGDGCFRFTDLLPKRELLVYRLLGEPSPAV